MGKGQAAVLLIIVALVVIFIFVSPQIFKPQPVTEPIRFKNDIISLENFEVSNLKPIKGSIITISFDVTNNGDKEVEDVKIDFGGTVFGRDDDLNIVECELDNIDRRTKKSCTFSRLESLDARKVTASFKVSGEGTRTILITANYPYSGTREALIPIIDDKTLRKPPVQFKQSQPSFGPFVVDIIPPTKGWAIADQPFEIKFKLRFVGSTAVGIPLPSLNELKIEEKKFVVGLGRELQVVTKENGDYLSCQFKAGESEIEGDNDISYPLVNSEREIKVNQEYNCNLQADVKPGELFGYKLGTIKVKFSYDFEFQKSQTINVIRAAS